MDTLFQANWYRPEKYSLTTLGTSSNFLVLKFKALMRIMEDDGEPAHIHNHVGMVLLQKES